MNYSRCLVDDMKFIELIIIILYLSNIFARRRHKVISSESIENILYYKGCNHKQRPTATPVQQMRSSPPQQCKMICTMCCGDQCVDSQRIAPARQAQKLEPKVPPILKPNMQKERRKDQPKLSPTIPQRRGLSFTRENIKSLISKDEDIRKILKDLVRVTMQKVNLMQLIKAKQNVIKKNSEMSDESGSENVL
ncbi:unnamed protein product, partial [Brenthis ino]